MKEDEAVRGKGLTGGRLYVREMMEETKFEIRDIDPVSDS